MGAGLKDLKTRMNEFLEECYKEEERLALKIMTVHKLKTFYTMKTIFRKVSVTEGLPKDGKEHYYILKDGNFGDNPKFSIHKEQIKIIKRTCEYWLEEIELLSDEEIKNISEKEYIYNDPNEIKGVIEGMKLMRDFVLGCSPISENSGNNGI